MTRSDTTPKLEILIVDDDKMVSFLHGKVLEKFNLNSAHSFFGNGKEAIEFLKTYPKKDNSFLILLDLQMPVMDGWEFLENCKQMDNASKVSVIVVTSSISHEDLYRALQYKNVLGFSSKPFTKDSVKALLDFPAIRKLFIEMEYQALENDTW